MTTVTATVVTMTIVSGIGIRLNVAGLTLCQSIVLSAAIIMTAASATIGICAISSLSAGHQHQQHDRGHRRRNAGAALPDLHVDDGLGDHRATADAAIEAGGDVGHPERPGFPALVRPRVGQVVDQLGRQQRLEQADKGDADRGRPDDAQRVEVERDRERSDAGSPGAIVPSPPTLGTVRCPRITIDVTTMMATSGAGTDVVMRGMTRTIAIVSANSG